MLFFLTFKPVAGGCPLLETQGNHVTESEHEPDANHKVNF